MRATYTVPDYVVVSEFFDGGGPVAQANVDTTGKATGFGSLPYPGENAVTAPGLLTFATGVPVPGYPFYARADYPVTPSSEVKVGDQPVTIDRDGVHPSGQTVPVPIGTGSDSINQALAQGGVTVKTIAGNDVEGGQAGDVLEVTSKHTIPVEGNPKGTFIYRIG